MAHWQGYLSRDRFFFGGLTEINRTLLGSIFLRENLVFIKARGLRTLIVSLAFGPVLHFSSPYLVACHSFSSATNFAVRLALQLMFVSRA